MLRLLPSSVTSLLSRVSPLPLSFCNFRFRFNYTPNNKISEMGDEYLLPKERKLATLRLYNVASFMTELLELKAENPSMHVLFIPGNPGIIQFYKEFVEAVYDMLGGCASVTAIGHISHTRKDWESGKLFSLQDQIDHKVAFINQEVQNTEIPILLVGHSVGSYISLKIFNRLPERVKYCIGLYPFLSLNKESSKQAVIGKIAASRILCPVLSSLVGVLGLLPSCTTTFLVKMSVGKSWSTTAVEALCSHLLKYHTLRNVLFMAETEFIELAEEPDWMFMKEKQDKLAFLFGIDDHWGPLSMFEEISKKVPNIDISIEKEGHTHAYSCTEAGSVWVADHIVGLIKRQFQFEPGSLASLKTKI